jgi:hypothetical protein
VSSDQQQRTIDFPETLIRIGILPSTEFRLFAPNYYHHAITPTGVPTGFSGLQIGVKQRLFKHHNFTLTAVATLITPTGASSISGDHYEGSLQIPWTDELSEKWKIGGMASVYSRTQNGLYPTTGEATFVVYRNLTQSWTVFTEYAADFPARGRVMHTAHMGTTYKITRNQQIDFHAFVGLSLAAINHAIGAGYSFRFR